MESTVIEIIQNLGHGTLLAYILIKLVDKYFKNDRK